MAYGDKRDYPKIDIYVNGRFLGCTTWAATCREAIREVSKKRNLVPEGAKVTARFAKE